MSGVHDVFHVSMLYENVTEPYRALQHLKVEYAPTVSEEIQLEKIMNARDMQPMDEMARPMKVHWQGRSTEKAMWEREEEVRAKHLELFEDTGL